MAIHKIKIFSGRGSEYLAQKIAASFGTTLGQSEVLRFSDGEFQPSYNESQYFLYIIYRLIIQCFPCFRRIAYINNQIYAIRGHIHNISFSAIF